MSKKWRKNWERVITREKGGIRGRKKRYLHFFCVFFLNHGKERFDIDVLFMTNNYAVSYSLCFVQL